MGFYSNVIFPPILNRVMQNPEMTRERPLVLANAQGDIFEVGFGTGLNLPHYPETVKKIVTADPNAASGKIAQKQIDRSPIEVDQHVMSGDDLPFDDASFDTVVCTWTLCSIENAGGALDEFHRILRPGGKFLFIEHGLSDDPKVQKWQHRLNPIWKIIGDGCNLNRDHRELIQDHHFTFDELDNFQFKGPKFAGYMYRGIAGKN